MRSPFPGMDPYLERRWGDVHTKVVTYACDALQPRLPADLTARSEERVMIGDEVDDERPIRSRVPDVGVTEGYGPAFAGRGGTAVSEDVTTAVMTATEPVPLRLFPGPSIDRYVRIEDTAGERLVTAIEVLSPKNKARGVGRRDYLRKRDQFVNAEVSVVEIDLVRAGDWTDLLEVVDLGPRYDGDYHVVVRRSGNPDRLDVYPIRLAHRLPVIGVPLRETDADVTLDLQAIVDQVYANGRYDRTDYGKPCSPPLAGEAAAWADALLRAAGRRG